MAYQVCASTADCEDSWVLSFSSKRFLRIYGTPSAPVIARSLSHRSSSNARRSRQVNSLARGLSKNGDPRVQSSRVESNLARRSLFESRPWAGTTYTGYCNSQAGAVPRVFAFIERTDQPSRWLQKKVGGHRETEKERPRRNEKEKPRESRWHRPPRRGRLWRFIRVVRDVFFVEIITGSILTDLCVPVRLLFLLSRVPLAYAIVMRCRSERLSSSRPFITAWGITYKG